MISLSKRRDAVIAALVARRKELGWTQTDLGRRALFGQGVISQWEQRRYDPKLSKLLTWCEAMGYELAIRKKGGE